MSAPFKLCLLTDSVDFNPFRKIKDGNEFKYLLLSTVSYLSNRPEEQSLIEAFTFEPDGLKVTMRVSADAKWQDGSPLTPLEAALGIAKALYFRPLGEKVKVKGTEKINDEGWEQRSYSGVSIIDERTFQLSFETSIDNLPGVLVEALSLDSRGNRMWPARITSLKDSSSFDLVSKFPVKKTQEGQFVLSAHGYNVALVPRGKCSDADFASISTTDAYKKIADYDLDYSKNKSVFYLVINSSSDGKAKSKEDRGVLAAWFRSALKTKEILDKPGLDFVDSHFLNEEPGAVAGIKWSSTVVEKVGKKFPSITVMIENLSLATSQEGKAIEAQAVRDGIEVKWVAASDKANAPTVFLGLGRQKPQRPLWIQNAFSKTNGNVERFLDGTPETRKAVNAIKEKSAATLPLKPELLASFEKSVFAESSVVPLFRVSQVELSRKGLPIALTNTESGEFTFSKRN